MTYKLGSLFDGSGGFPLAGAMFGIEPVWASEVEPYPIAVTRVRFPNMKHLGDISKINGAEIEPVDVITFGSPCQDLSVAGKRAGLKHESNGDDETTRSGLFVEAVRIIKEMRDATNGVYPRFAVWENVPGAFNSNKGEDFRIVLEELIKIAEPDAVMPAVPDKGWAYADCYTGEGFSLAYRVFDAQYWGVPQRRRRIHLVLDLGGQCAGEILFKREGLRGYFEEGRTPWEGAAPDAQGGSGATDREGEGTGGFASGGAGGNSAYLLGTGEDGRSWDDRCVSTGCGGGRGLDAVGFTNRGYCSGDKAETCRAESHGAIPMVAFAQTVTFEPGIAAREGGHIYEGVSGTIRANAGDNRMAVCCMATRQGEDRANELVGETKVYESHPMDSRIKELDGASPTVSAKWHKGAADTPLVVAYSIENHPADSRVNIDDSGKVQCLTSRMGTGGGNVPMVMEPVYCLQGNGIDRADTAGCNGKGVREDVCYTLNTIDRPAVAFQTYQKVTGPLMANSHPGSYTGQDAFNDMLVAGEAYQRTVGALYARDYKGVGSQYVSEDKLVVQGMDCRNGKLNGDLCGTLQAKPGGGFSYNCIHPVLIEKPPQYIVRRLTPTECARLQGFPDWWGHIAQKDELTDEEYSFWLDVRNTHARINGKVEKEYTKPQMLTWYNKLHTDSAEYKMWGNGIALPPALYVMQGIVDVLTRETQR